MMWNSFDRKIIFDKSSNFCWTIDKLVIVIGFESIMGKPFQPCCNFPFFWFFNHQLNGLLYSPNNIKKHSRSIKKGMGFIDVTGDIDILEVIGIDFVFQFYGSVLAFVHSPCLLIQLFKFKLLLPAIMSLKFLYIPGKIQYSVIAWHPGWHRKIKISSSHIVDCYFDLEEMCVRLVDINEIGDFEIILGKRRLRTEEKSQQSYG